MLPKHCAQNHCFSSHWLSFFLAPPPLLLFIFSKEDVLKTQSFPAECHNASRPFETECRFKVEIPLRLGQKKKKNFGSWGTKNCVVPSFIWLTVKNNLETTFLNLDLCS